MLRYRFSLVVFMFLTAVFIISSGISLLAFLDLRSFFIVGIVPFLFIWILNGHKETFSAIGAPFINLEEREQVDLLDNIKERLIKALHVLRAYDEAVWAASIIGFIICIVGMFRNLNDSTMVGPNLAIASITILYKCLTNVLVIIPYTLTINKKLRELNKINSLESKFNEKLKELSNKNEMDHLAQEDQDQSREDLAQPIQEAPQEQRQEWICSNGHGKNFGKFCIECGEPAVWDCVCGNVGNTGKFCAECGSARPWNKE